MQRQGVTSSTVQAEIETASDGSYEVTQTKIALRQINGPFPSPEALLGYQKVDPALVNRIFTRAELEMNHRHKLENAEVAGDFASSRRGQWMAFSVAMTSLLGAGFLGWLQAPVAAAIVGALPIAQVVGLFLKSRQERRKESEREPTP
jgi:uncharacterized membrane protein